MFRVDLVSSTVPFFIIFILWCVRVISSVFDECRVIELQLIIGELIEQISEAIESPMFLDSASIVGAGFSYIDLAFK